MRARAALRLLASGALHATIVLGYSNALAQVLYKWTDKDGKIHYSDTFPHGFADTVTTIEPDAKPDPAPVAADKPNPKSAHAPEPVSDLATTRRAQREAFAARITRARDKLEAAKSALADQASPEDSERQVVQQRVERNNPRPSASSSSTGGMFGSGGMHGGAARSNCSTVTGADRRTVTTCSTLVPTEAYYERQQRLEEAVRQAQAELAAAEEAYRRGVD